MNIKQKVTALLAGVVFLTAGTAYAANITIFDGQGSGSSWNGIQEDNEVSTGCVGNQSWDLEGFYLNGTTLAMVGGYNFKEGNSTYTSGDIFINTGAPIVTGTTTPGNGYFDVANTFGYDYAIRLNFTTNTYNVYGLDANSRLKTAWYDQNDSANPFQYISGSTGEKGSGSFSQETYGTGALAKIAGYENKDGSTLLGDLSGDNTHYLVTGLDLSFLGHGTFFTSHFTMGCGNDNLMGRSSTPVPEPGTLLLLGFGLVGIAGFRRRKRN